VATGVRLVRPGPSVTAEEARAVVAELRSCAAAAAAHVRDYTGLVAETDGSSVAVIDRPGWVRANAGGFRTVIEPLVDKLERRSSDLPGAGVVTAVGSRLTGVETGVLLGYLATKVLGQYELIPPYDGSASRAGTAPTEDARPGRLLLVAPNIVAAEREMGVDPRDFRLWVCMHEETHRVQFGAVPWLRDHLMGELRAFLDDTELDAMAILRRLRAAAGAVSDAVRGDGAGGEPGLTLVEAVQTPDQRKVLDRITAVMSLLEGHADYVMDGVGPDVIPSVATIRRRFQQRRTQAGRPEQIVRRLLGIDAKLRQYRDGEAYVRGVVDRVGMAGFNRVWERAENLPTPAELKEPELWVARVH
jgi:coenzyme F420 biosynthesis associated uncharacterized protein